MPASSALPACPAVESLARWLEGQSGLFEAGPLELHLEACPSCRLRLVLKEEGVGSDAATSAVDLRIVIAFGPEHVPLNLQRPFIAALQAEGCWVSSLDDGPIWAVWPCSDASDPTQLVQALRDCLARLERCLKPGSPHVALVTISSDSTPTPKVSPLPGSLTEKLNELQAGEIWLTNSVVSLLGPLDGRPVLTNEAPPVPFRRWDPEARSLSWRTVTDAQGRHYEALIVGGEDLLAGFTLEVRTIRAQRGHRSQVAPAQSTPLDYGDQLRVRLRVPGGSSACLIRQRDAELLPPVELAMAAGDDLWTREASLLLGDQGGMIRPLVLVSRQRPEKLEALIKQCNAPTGRGPNSRLLDLVHLLRAKDSGDVALLVAGEFPHAAGKRHLAGVPEGALTALSSAKLANAESLLRAALARVPPVSDANLVRLYLGITLRRRRRRGEARTELETVLCAATGTGDEWLVAMALRELGRVHTDSGRLRLAGKQLAYALARFRCLDDPMEAAMTRLYQAWWLLRRGEPDAAMVINRSVLDTAMLAGDVVLEVAARQALAQDFQELGRLRDAEEQHRRALSIMPEHANASRARGYGELGWISQESGRALEAATRYRAQLRAALQIEKHEVDLARINLGQALAARGLFPEAIDQLLRVSPAHVEPIQFDLTRVCLAAIFLRIGERTAARRWLRQVPWERARVHPELAVLWGLTAGGLAESSRTGRAEDAYRRVVRLFEEKHRELDAEARSEFLEKAAVLFEKWIGSLEGQGAPDAELVMAMEQARARAFLDALQLRGQGVARREVASSQTALERVQGRRYTLAKIQSLLPERTVFLEAYVLPDRIIWARISKDSLEHRVQEVAREDLERLCSAAFAACRRRGRRGDEDLRALSRAVFSGLNDWLDALEPGDVLGFVPHGPLHELPLHALPLPEGCRWAGQPLVMTADIVYAPSLQAVAFWMEQLPTISSGAVVMGDAEEDLEYARREASRIAELLGLERPHLGDEATLEALQQGAGSAWIHLAVHGVTGGGRKSAALRLAPPRTDAARSSTRGARRITAATPRPIHELDVAAIARLPLAARLVVLSACKSGVGRLTAAGEGPSLLSWAFLAAGARAVVASRWKVSDKHTERLMVGMYERLKQGASPVAALCGAQREMIAGKRDWSCAKVLDKKMRTLSTYYWGAFFLTGDWRATAPVLSAGRLDGDDRA